MPTLKNQRHERFCQYLLKGKTADEAYQLAGFKPNRGNAATLKANQSIVDRMAELQANVAEKAELSAAMVLAEMGRLGMSDVRRLFTDEGQLRPLHTLDAEAAACISSIEVVTKRVPGGEPSDVEHVAKIRLWDKRAALADLGKHFGLFNEKVQHNHSVTVRHEDANRARATIARLLEEGVELPALPAPGPETMQ